MEQPPSDWPWVHDGQVPTTALGSPRPTPVLWPCPHREGLCSCVLLPKALPFSMSSWPAQAMDTGHAQRDVLTRTRGDPYFQRKNIHFTPSRSKVSPYPHPIPFLNTAGVPSCHAPSPLVPPN